ncbi:type II toxin-antitoxin system RelE/ParE family toxin [Rhizobacter sp. Root1221]|uniref:type II toxin-antitoxin system RelE/ParE family toxin n=1 Tax=Rhizobacter sp. Root1221 TaxID=1736433 RepID=UPI0006F39B6F|nr:type II toxin-antitoxin system RelE/ParE family toxin [Rhizobacter sp. Root1221]KQV91710.1 plasmid stabilization protein [Rhizobacter sp. Root1221]
MPRLIWSPPALLDVQRLYRFMAPKNLDAARRAVKAIRHGVTVLGQQPGVGRPIDDMPDEFREWIIDFGDGGYIARYRIDPDAVTILAVRHQKEAS